MTVDQLIKELQTVESNLQVYVARDPEGNGFLPLCDIGELVSNDGEFLNIWEAQGEKVIVLWP